MQQFTTSRLHLMSLKDTDAAFIQELVNTPGWLRFIGDRKVHNTKAALAYINRINTTPGIQYWVTFLNNTRQPIGLITLIQRSHLPCPDIGFAFLPEHGGNGYAFEAASAVMTYLRTQQQQPQLAAVTMPANTASIRLLEKLGLTFEKEIQQDEETLLVYTCKLA